MIRFPWAVDSREVTLPHSHLQALLGSSIQCGDVVKGEGKDAHIPFALILKMSPVDHGNTSVWT